MPEDHHDHGEVHWHVASGCVAVRFAAMEMGALAGDDLSALPGDGEREGALLDPGRRVCARRRRQLVPVLPHNGVRIDIATAAVR
jgi:hypothetical protein